MNAELIKALRHCSVNEKGAIALITKMILCALVALGSFAISYPIFYLISEWILARKERRWNSG